jgi:signal transduction histidine kinase
MRELLGEMGRTRTFDRVIATVNTRLTVIYSPEFVEVLCEKEISTRDFSVPAVRIPFSNPSGKISGCLSLGRRKSDEPYMDSDVELLELVASQIGLMREMLLVAGKASDVTHAVLEERTRIAQELHDTVGQGFAGISLYLAAAGKSLAGSPEQAGTYLEAARKLARTSAQETRESVFGLRSSASSAGGTHLEARLRGIANRLVGDPTLSPAVALDLPEGICDLASDDAGWHLARVAEEAVTNACKHAAAKQINVRLRTHGHSLELSVKDDGDGFELTRSKENGFGLQGMRERMGHVHGTVEIWSAPGQGTEVRALVPVALGSS